MIRRNGEYEVSIRTNMRGGKGDVKIEHFWSSDELKSRTRLFSKLTLAPGSSIGFHKHEEEEEVFVVLRGQAKMQETEGETILNPGDTMLTGKGAGHAVESIGSEPLEMIAVIMQYDSK